MKISVPWPAKIESQTRIKESLSMWEDKSILLVCLCEPCDDEFLKDFQTVVLPRNSKCIGTKVPKCFICDMIKYAIELFPNEDWYGFGNSDVVPAGDLLDQSADKDALVYHRTEINDWQNRDYLINRTPEQKKMYDDIYDLRSSGLNSKHIARELNKKSVSPPSGHSEWTYRTVNEIISKEGEVFFFGQDLFIFKSTVVNRVLKEYLEVKDPILGTGGFDPRLSKWIMDNCNGLRIINKIFHKRHTSEWTTDEVEYNHNGGDMIKGKLDERYEYYNNKYVESLRNAGYNDPIPPKLKLLIKENSPDDYEKLFPD